MKTSSEIFGQCGNLYWVTFSEEKEFTFLKPVTIRIRYTLDSLPEDAKEENLRIGLLGPMDCWELVSNSIVDKTNRVVSAATEHFSGVGLLYEIPVTGTIKLAFPLPNRVPYGGSSNSVIVNAVFDHSMSSPYTANDTVEAFNGERGTVKSRYITAIKKNHPLHGYRKPDGSIFFSHNEIKYSGHDTLFYDGHPGYDFTTIDQNPLGNVPVLAAADGKVVVIDLAYGAVCIKHSNGYFTKYFHLLPNTIRVKVNDSVVKGETIGISGATGAPNNAPHLHFEVLNGSYKPIDPYKENLWESKVVNKRPNPPKIPSGPSTGWVNVACNFTASTTDPEGDSVAYQFYWKEGDISNWSNFVPSGTSVSMSKSWSSPGTYLVKVRAKDIKGAVSFWSAEHQIKIFEVRWQKIFGGSNDDYGYSVQQTTDSGYIIIGYTYSFGNGGADLYLIKTDINGNLLWEKTFGGIDNDYGYSVQQTNDGGYIITGYTYSFGNYKPNVYLIKTDESGNLLWEKFLPSNRSYSVRQTSDMGYIIVGDIKYYYPHSYMECVDLIKTDENGNLLWKKTFIERSGHGYSVQQTLDGGYIIAGCTGARGVDIYLIKTDMNGNTLWVSSLNPIRNLSK